MYDGKKCLFMHRVIKFCATKGSGIKGHWSGSLPSGPPRKNGPSAEVRGVACKEDVVVSWVIMIDSRQAMRADHKILDGLEGPLVILRPGRELEFRSFGRQHIQDACMVCKIGEVISNIANEAKEGTHVHDRARDWPVEDPRDLGGVGLNPMGKDAVTKEKHFSAEELSLFKGAEQLSVTKGLKLEGPHECCVHALQVSVTR